MQTIQNHVVSLDLSKKLVEMGIKIESEYWWIKIGNTWKVMVVDFSCDVRCMDNEKYPAPLASELGEVLPHGYHVWYSDGDGIDAWCCVYFSEPELDCSYEHFITADTMPNAMAKMLIYLKEKGLI